MSVPRFAVAFWISGVLFPSLPSSGHGQVAEAQAALQAGRYDEAIAAYESAVGEGQGDPAASRGLIRALSEVGRYQEAEKAARAALAAHPESGDLWTPLGEVLARLGRWKEAEDAYERALRAGAPDSLPAILALAVLHVWRGEREQANRGFDRLVAAYNASNRSALLSADDLVAVGTALRYLGAQNPDAVRDALRAFDEAAAAAPDDPSPRVRAGELFLSKYNSQEAAASFQEVLERNPHQPAALLGMARRAWFDGSSKAFDLVAQALETNPNLVEAHVFLARLHLDVEEVGPAEAELDRALEVDPRSLEALSMRAAARYMRGDRTGFESRVRHVLALGPRYAEVYLTAGQLAVRNRLYADAVELARRALELDQDSWDAHGLLGLNLLRTGQIREGRSHLETAFAGDPFNVWFKNTLDLLDVVDRFEEVDSPRFRFFAQAKEAPLLAVYMPEVAEEAYDRLSQRYGYRPSTPIRVEVFDRHADFSVRTVGLAGLGALGVSFGSVLAMDSPSARERGAFNWGSTLWHEISHAFTLGITEHRIPRWFSEGLAVHDEHGARPSWGADPTPDFLLAFLHERLPPIRQLNRGFVRPSYPGQLQHAYYQSSLVSRMIEEQEGLETLRAMLEGYREGLDTEAVFARVLGEDLGTFDRRFRAYLETEFATPLAALRRAAARGVGSGQLGAEARRPGARGDRAAAAEGEPAPDDFLAQWIRGRTLFETGQTAEAEPYLERARSLFPGYAGGDAPAVYLAAIHAAAGDTGQAIQDLSAHTAVNESAYDENVRLAELMESGGDAAGAARALERAVFVDPFERSVHERIAELAEDRGDSGASIRERRAVVALDPVDLAGALYRLARAYQRGGQPEAAHREVMRALEMAPNYEEALDLLLELAEEREKAERGSPRSRFKV